MLRSLGAPVMEPPGKVARRQSTMEEPLLRVPLTVLTRLCTVAYVSTSIRPGTCTEPTCQVEVTCWNPEPCGDWLCGGGLLSLLVKLCGPWDSIKGLD